MFRSLLPIQISKTFVMICNAMR